ncbi:unnamed protein product [Amoebophrya sp. A25]|nr:unnamed protein product [Amoebophrya sp. A25]|eukprot:GSA25T00014104001.1
MSANADSVSNIDVVREAPNNNNIAVTSGGAAAATDHVDLRHSGSTGHDHSANPNTALPQHSSPALVPAQHQHQDVGGTTHLGPGRPLMNHVVEEESRKQPSDAGSFDSMLPHSDAEPPGDTRSLSGTGDSY